MSDLLSPILFIMDGDEPEAFWSFVGLMDAIETSFQKDQACCPGRAVLCMDVSRTSLRRTRRRAGCMRSWAASGASWSLLIPSYLRTWVWCMPLAARHVWLLMHCSLAARGPSDRQGAASMIFCFRWVIIMMKREFEFDDIMRLWEVWQPIPSVACPTPWALRHAVSDMYMQVLWTRHLSSNFLVFVCAGILHGHRAALLSCDMGLDGLLRVCRAVPHGRPCGTY
jgi:hypothetical protein